MSMAWDLFTPWPALAGGVLIGVAAALMVLLLGRIMGVSGIVGSLLQGATWRSRTQWGWRVAFVVGLLAAPLVWQCFARLPALELPGNPWLVAVAGLLVGWGTRMGAGCTSGHGVCGLSRLSLRSLAATGMFMATGVATVWVLRHMLGG